MVRNPTPPPPHRNSARGCGAPAPRGTIKAVAHSTCRSLTGLTVVMAWYVCPLYLDKTSISDAILYKTLCLLLLKPFWGGCGVCSLG